jgi:hypothetical protein
MRKYAGDLQDYDILIIDGRNVILDFIDAESDPDFVIVEGFFEDDGESFEDDLDPDEEVVVLS